MLPDQKLNALVARHTTLERDLSAALPPETFVKLSREFAELAPVVEAVKSYRAAQHELDGLTSLIADPATDAEMRSIAEAERPQLEALSSDFDVIAWGPWRGVLGRPARPVRDRRLGGRTRRIHGRARDRPSRGRRPSRPR